MISSTMKASNAQPSECHDFTLKPEKARRERRRCQILVAVLAAAVFFTVGFLIGYFAPKSSQGTSQHSRPLHKVHEPDYEQHHDKFQSLISTKELEEKLRFFSESPHIAGTERQKYLADFLATKWKEYGFDQVEKPEYKVLLSYPEKDKPNRVSIINNGKVQFESVGKMKISPEPGKPSMEHLTYLAYAPRGTVEGNLVYANYGFEDDFQTLTRHNISVNGSIVIIRSRYITGAVKHGAIGVLVYADPEFAAQEGYDANNTYPHSLWVPPNGVQEGSILFGPDLGDPQTPGIPSIKGMYRRPYNESNLPKIPAHVISYGDALELLRNLSGKEAPKGWQGGLNITMRFGPGFWDSNAKLRLEVNNQLKQRSIFNVIGTIYGCDEPDRYVLVGNHRDSWSFGAVDALSGTTTTNEMARVLGVLLKMGWRPRRTIKICSWGGEEFNLIGSHEWVEENRQTLSERAVAYINLDIAVCGDFVLRARLSPLFKNATYKWASKIKDPTAPDGSKTMYDTWLERTPSMSEPDKPKTFNLFTSSDYLSFYQYLGIPCGDYGYWFAHNNVAFLYPAYHTQQDTFYWVKTFIDPKFEIHKAMTGFGGGMLLDLSDSPILPLDVTSYAKALNDSYTVLTTSTAFSNHGISLDTLQNSVHVFFEASAVFVKALANLDGTETVSERRMLNDQIVRVEKAFIHPYGLPGQPQARHVAFNYGFHNFNYGQATFPGVTEAVHLAKKSGDWAEVQRQLSIAAQAVLSAADVLRPLRD